MFHARVALYLLGAEPSAIAGLPDQCPARSHSIKLIELMRACRHIVFMGQDHYQPPSHKTTGRLSHTKHIPQSALETVAHTLEQAPGDLDHLPIMLRTSTLYRWLAELETEAQRVRALIAAREAQTPRRTA